MILGKRLSRYTFPELGAIQPEGWLRDQSLRLAEGFAGHLDELSPKVGGKIFVRRNASPDSDVGWWNGESEGNWIDGAARLAAVVEAPWLRDKVARYASEVIAHQGADGYLGVYSDSARQQRLLAGELWTQSRIYLALLAYHAWSGRQEALDAVVRAARLTLATFADGGWRAFWDPRDPGNDGGRAHGMMIVEPLLELYRLTGDGAFLQAAMDCYDGYSQATVDWGVRDCQLGRLQDPLEPFAGHGVHVCEALRLPFLLYEWTGEESYLAAGLTGYRKMLSNLGAGGACKSDEYVGARDVGGVPLPGAGHEACTLTELLFSFHVGAAVTGDLGWADRAEHLLFNAAEGALAADGGSMAYLSADNQFEATDHRGWQWAYSPVHRVVCCAPNLVRLLPGHISRMVANTSDGGLAVLFYGPSRADLDVPEAGRVTLRQETGYPFDDEVRLSVRAEAASWRFPLRLRIPGWSRSASVVAPPDVRVRREGAELVLEAAWREHEVVLSFDPSIRHLAAVDGQVAVARGPLVYALPIAHEERVVGEHALPGFADRQFTPVAEARWDVALQVDRDDPARAFELVRTDGGFPWEAPPLALRTTVLDATWTRTTVAPNAEEVVLVPYGSTVLRRTCFPAVDRTGRPLLPVAVMKPDA